MSGNQASGTPMQGGQGEYIGRIIEITEIRYTEQRATFVSLQKQIEAFDTFLLDKNNLYDPAIQAEYRKKMVQIGDAIGLVIEYVDVREESKARNNPQQQELTAQQLEKPSTQVVVVNQTPAKEGEEAKGQGVTGAISRAASAAGGFLFKKKEFEKKASSLLSGDKVPDILDFARQLPQYWTGFAGWHGRQNSRMRTFPNAVRDREISTELEKDFLVKIRQATLSNVRAAVLHLEGGLTTGLISIARAQAQTIKEIYPTFIKEGYAEEGLVAGPGGVSRMRKSRAGMNTE